MLSHLINARSTANNDPEREGRAGERAHYLLRNRFPPFSNVLSSQPEPESNIKPPCPVPRFQTLLFLIRSDSVEMKGDKMRAIESKKQGERTKRDRREREGGREVESRER